MAAKPKVAKIAPAPSGAPRWTYAVGAIVGAAAVLWGIVSYFIPKPEPPKITIPVPAPPAPKPEVSMEGGCNNIGVANMSGGTITQGAKVVCDAPKTKK